MELYPAIDLRGGRCVRLYQGDFEKETVYGADPVAVARRLAAAGARWLHVVDLDAARTGEPENHSVIAEVAHAVAPATRVQAGGGLRHRPTVESLLGAGVARVVMGSAALENPGLVRDLAAELPVVVGLDGRGRQLAVRGWTAEGGDLFEALASFEDAGVVAVVITDINRDGTLTGPDLEGLAGVLEATALEVIASGGVGSLNDLEALATLEAGGRRLGGAIVGKALYEGLFTVEEALATCRASG